MAGEQVYFSDEQNRRIRDCVRSYERSQPRNRPQAIKPRFSGRPGKSLTRFQLLEDLTWANGHAKAAIMTLNESDEWEVADGATEIEVFDPYKGGDNLENRWVGLEGYQGWCQRRGSASFVDEGESESESDDETRAVYDIVEMEMLAPWVMWHAYEAIDPDDMKFRATLVKHDWGIAPVEGSDTFFVYAPFGHEQDIVEGAYGQAKYDYSQGKYYVESYQHVALRATALLNGDCCSSGTPSIDNFVIDVQGDYCLPPPTTPTVATNPRGHAGIDNAKVLLERAGLKNAPGDAFEWNWEVVGIAKVARTPIVDLRVNTDGDVQCKKATIYVEACGPVGDWESLIEGTDC
ncbi:hypothetical protein [Anatilimnocola floriformis]|uniref:hypothetical protein n=1 Tax=Anatilimnocola floriformis TaxID=2948575 RepID=UPI0020C36B65|nr:hypothetical protein [Anatilimnocola floriformis]